ncbi:MAG: VWA domain-containing protein [Myxococcales bacterium]|nr:VWA domain-containing protein [Myxococcales bacterium]
MLSRSLLAALLLSLTACGGGLQVRTIRAAQQRPSNVAVYFRLQSSAGEPVGGLTAESFRIYEDGALVSPYESKQVVLNPEVAAAHYALLLVDMSGSVSESGAAATVVEAAAAFVDKVETAQKVAVFAFDGSASLHPIAPFQHPGGAKAGVRSLSTFKPQDPSTNLNGAVIKGLAELEQALAKDTAPLKFGTLVVFTDGTDRAARASREELRKAVKETPHEIFAIGLGAELKKGTLDDVGKSGTALAENREAVVTAFESIATKVEAQTKSYYLLGYCSPARAGKHKVTVEAVLKSDKGAERTGRAEADFDAAGFGPGCDPKTPPTFDVTKGEGAAPPAPKEAQPAKDDAKDRPAKDGKDKPKPKAKPKNDGVNLPPPPPPSTTAPPPAKPDGKQDFNP